MTAEKKNLPASVAARLLHRARQTGDEYQTLLTSYCFERAMLLRVWSDQPYRATRDLDLLRRGEDSFDAIHADLDRLRVPGLPGDPWR